MRIVIALCIACVLLYCTACEQNKAATHAVVKQDSLLLYEVPVTNKAVKGLYKGDFKGSPISISLMYMAGKRICGYDVHKGLRRNISGSILLDGSQLHLVMQEPGTNEYDGTFDMWLDSATGKIKGKWVALSEKEQSAAQFTLTKENEDVSYWAMFTDTTGVELNLKPDGSCTYAYMINDSTDAAQKLSFTGSYKFAKDSATITFFWQPNEIFPSRNATFTVIKTKNEDFDNATMLTFKGEGKELTELFMP